MPRSCSSILLTVIVAAGLSLAASGPPPALADANLNCDAYAGAAIAQNGQNLAQNCGFTGGRWSNAFRAHADWCAAPGTTMADLVREDRSRQEALAQCASRAIRHQRACQAYARQAVADRAAAAGARCGVSGGRWSSDYARHFEWCLTASTSTRDGETAARRNQLAGCLAARRAAADQARRDACARYAAMAVGQQKENGARGCAFSGKRWSGDFFSHFNWCMAAGPDMAGRETAARNSALEKGCMLKVCTTRKVASVTPPFFKSVTRCRMVPRQAR